MTNRNNELFMEYKGNLEEALLFSSGAAASKAYSRSYALTKLQKPR
jgi:hypothetical protein